MSHLDMREWGRWKCRGSFPFGEELSTFTPSQRKIPGESSYGEMKSTLSEVLMRKARGLLKTLMRSLFIRRWKKSGKKIWFLFWSIFPEKKAFFFSTSRIILWKREWRWRRSISRAVCTGRSAANRSCRTTGFADLRRFRKN